MTSGDFDEMQILEKWMELNGTLSNVQKPGKHLDDIILFNNQESFIHCSINSQLKESYSLLGILCSNHPPYTLELERNMTCHSKQSPQIFAFAKADWVAVQELIVQKPFSPYCFSNTELLRQ